MASETLCVSGRKGGGFCGESKTHNNIDNLDRKSTISCSYEQAGKSCSQEINRTLRFSGDCIDQNLREANSDACCGGNAPSFGIGCDESDAVQSQNVRQEKGNTLQDLYMQDNYDDEDDDDSDWEPGNHFVARKWFCSNCTMPNLDDVYHCDVCGEHKEYEISGYDSFRSFIGQGAQVLIDFNAVPKGQGTLPENCTAIGFDERMLLHSEVELKPHPHPERPDRLRAIVASLSAAGIFPGKCQLIPAREITLEELQLVHSLDHIVAVQQTSQLLSSYFTSDTYANKHSACAARIAAGLCADLALSIMSGRTKNGFALVRPPGHHAGIKNAMGFCLHNNAAVAALAAQRAGAKKILIVDWDVHHGNGTQEIFNGNKSVLYVSLHRHEGGRFYPGTGAADEVGVMDGRGYSVNIPWSRGGVVDNDYIFAFQNVVLPIASEFDPDITIISAGFDAARGDPLGCCDVTPAGYAQMTYLLSPLSKGKLLVILEGGYNLHSISSSATAVVKVLLGQNPECEMSGINPSKAGLLTVLQVLQTQREFWPVLESNYIALQSQWELISSSRRKEAKKRHLAGPVWWRWGSKRFVYDLIYRGLPFTGHSKRLCSQPRS